MAAATSLAIPSASTADTIWRRPAPSRDSRSSRRNSGSVHKKPSRLRRARKKPTGRPERLRPESREEKMIRPTPTTSFECTISEGLAHIVLNQADRGNPIDGAFCREFNLGMAELSERDDVRAVLVSARGKLFSVGGDLGALAASGDNLPQTVKIWTSDLHHAIARMVRLRAPVVMAVQGNVAG